MEPHSEMKIAKMIGLNITFGEFFFYFKCCQPQIHWYDIQVYTNIGELCVIPMNVHDRTVQWCSSAKMATAFAYSQL